MPVRTKDTFLVFGAPLIEQAEIDEVVDSLKSGWLGTGPKVAQFEADFAAYVGGSHAAACNSCTAALHLSLVALGLKPGDEVITTPLTFCASVNAIIHAGGTPVLARRGTRSPRTSTPNPCATRSPAAPGPSCPCTLPGGPATWTRSWPSPTSTASKWSRIAPTPSRPPTRAVSAGTFGDFGCFSFYVTKNVCTGEGGMIIARDETDIKNVKVLGLHGMSADAWKRFSDEGYKHYEVVHAGFKYNMMDIQAAIGIHQLARVEQNFIRRCEIWDRYQEAFGPLPVGCPAPERAGHPPRTAPLHP